jgi:hypothetical protein
VIGPSHEMTMWAAGLRKTYVLDLVHFYPFSVIQASKLQKATAGPRAAIASRRSTLASVGGCVLNIRTRPPPANGF